MRQADAGPNVTYEGETNVLKKSVNAAGFGLNHVNEELISIDLLNKLIVWYRASCGAAATNIFHPTCLSFCPFFIQQ